MEARDNAHVNQLLLIPCVILDFLCIHPFRDGNGRMSRLLSLLLLYKNGYDVGNMFHLKNKSIIIEHTTRKHYDGLRMAGIRIRIVISLLLKIFFQCSICAIRSLISALQ